MIDTAAKLAAMTNTTDLKRDALERAKTAFNEANKAMWQAAKTGTHSTIAAYSIVAAAILEAKADEAERWFKLLGTEARGRGITMCPEWAAELRRAAAEIREGGE